MIPFKIEAQYAEDTSDCIWSDEINWPVLPRIGETIQCTPGIWAKVKDICHTLCGKKYRRIVVVVRVSNEVYEKLIDTEGWANFLDPGPTMFLDSYDQEDQKN